MSDNINNTEYVAPVDNEAKKAAEIAKTRKLKNISDLLTCELCAIFLALMVSTIILFGQFDKALTPILIIIGLAVLAFVTYIVGSNMSEKFSALETMIAKGEADADGVSFLKVMRSRDLQKIRTGAKVRKVVSNVVIYAFLIVIALIVLFPFYWMIISSLKTLDEYKLSIPTLFPTRLVFGNYAEAFTKANLGQLFLNTVYVGLVSTILSLIITVLSAFAFARLEFKGKNTLFAVLLATMMIPGELFTITNYQTVYYFGWMNSFTVLIVPFLVSVFYIYLLKQNFMQIPNELYLAAKVDGTSDIKYLWKVMIPLSLPTLISITILKMMGAWNSYVWPNLVTDSDKYRLITNGLRNAFVESTGDVNIPVQMAAVAMVSAPLFLVFLFLRKYIMKGVSRSGIKG